MRAPPRCGQALHISVHMVEAAGNSRTLRLNNLEWIACRSYIPSSNTPYPHHFLSAGKRGAGEGIHQVRPVQQRLCDRSRGSRGSSGSRGGGRIPKQRPRQPHRGVALHAHLPPHCPGASSATPVQNMLQPVAHSVDIDVITICVLNHALTTQSVPPQ